MLTQILPARRLELLPAFSWRIPGEAWRGKIESVFREARHGVAHPRKSDGR
jgi:hypothetical protein